MMRISSKIAQQLSIDVIRDMQARLSKSQLQIAEGKRILTPSDDPSASSQILSLRQTLATNEQYQANITTASARLGLEETTLDGVTNLLHRVRELAVQANSDMLSADNRTAIAKEIELRVDELLGLANTKDQSGDYLFAGTKGQTQPFTHDGVGGFTYDGDQSGRDIQIGPTRKVAVGDSGSDVFLDVKNATGGNQSIFQTLWQFRDDLVANTPTTNIIADIDLAMENVLRKRAEVGTRLGAVEAQQDVNQSAIIQVEEVMSNTQDLDYAKAITKFNQYMMGLEAAQKTHAKIANLSLFNYV